MILTPYGVPFHPVVVIGLGKNLLFKSVLAHCGEPGRSSLGIKLLLNKTRLQSKLNHTLKLSDPYLLPL